MVLGQLHAALYAGQGLVGARGIGPVLMSVAPLFAAIPLGMLLANLAVLYIGPARRALDREARAQPNTDFSAAQRQLLRLSLIVAPIALGVAVVGALLPWQT